MQEEFVVYYRALPACWLLCVLHVSLLLLVMGKLLQEDFSCTLIQHSFIKKKKTFHKTA